MTPKEYLKQIAKYDYMIYAAEEEAQKLRDALDLKAISYTGDKIQTSPSDICQVSFIRHDSQENELFLRLDQTQTRYGFAEIRRKIRSVLKTTPKNTFICANIISVKCYINRIHKQKPRHPVVLKLGSWFFSTKNNDIQSTYTIEKRTDRMHVLGE